jgi:type VI secretion system secreted protein VgrG
MTVSGAAPGPGRVAFGKDPADTWTDGSVIGKPKWPATPPSAGAVPAQLEAAVTEVLPSKNWDVLEHGLAAVQGAGASLPAQATALAPLVASVLSEVIKSGKLPSLPAPTELESVLEVPELLAGEKLS